MTLHAPSFVRGGRRKLYAAPNPHDPSRPVEIWAAEDGSLFTVSDGDLIAGPVFARAVIEKAAAIAGGATPSLFDSIGQPTKKNRSAW